MKQTKKIVKATAKPKSARQKTGVKISVPTAKTAGQKLNRAIVVSSKGKLKSKLSAPEKFAFGEKKTRGKNASQNVAPRIKKTSAGNQVEKQKDEKRKIENKKTHSASTEKKVKSAAPKIAPLSPPARNVIKNKKTSIVAPAKPKTEKTKNAPVAAESKYARTETVKTDTATSKTKQRNFAEIPKNDLAKSARNDAVKIKSAVAAKKIISRREPVKTVVSIKTKLRKKLENAKSGVQKPSPTARAKKVETVERKIEAPVVAVKPKKKKAKAISSAVFRGRRVGYDFQVFPLDAEFENVSAIYVISKRKTDRNKRAHHALICIGQTDSISGEIKRHAKNCIKKHEANVISILPEQSEKKRLKIEEDLKAAHATACRAVV